jgi:lycopene beta-cyclase
MPACIGPLRACPARTLWGDGMSDVLDVIILGGGCAGLAVARDLALRTHRLRALVVEPRTAYSNDRTWCYWAPGPEELRPPSRAQWATWRVSSGGKAITHRPRQWHYHMVSSADYYADAVAAIQSSEGVRLMMGARANAISTADGLCHVDTTEGVMRSRFVIDTRPPGLDCLRAAPLAQVFSGLEVMVDRDTFDCDAATLMGNMRVEGGRLVFDYILPFSARHALVERTVFTRTNEDPAALDAPCLALVEQMCGPEVRVVRQERGWLPMGLPPLPRADGRVIRAGLPAGSLRPSTGYAFRRIQRWAAACANSLVETGAPCAEFSDPGVLRVMDGVFLRAMTRGMAGAPDDFLRMARCLDGDRFARFMSDEATWADWARIVLAFPKARYLGAVASVVRSSWADRRVPC